MSTPGLICYALLTPQMLGVRALQLQRCSLPQFKKSVTCSNSSNAGHLKDLRVLAEAVSGTHLVGLGKKIWGSAEAISTVCKLQRACFADSCTYRWDGVRIIRLCSCQMQPSSHVLQGR